MANTVKVSSIPFTNWCGWHLWIDLDNTRLRVAYGEWPDVPQNLIILKWRVTICWELDHLAVGCGRKSMQELGQYGFMINRSMPNTSDWCRRTDWRFFSGVVALTGAPSGRCFDWCRRTDWRVLRRCCRTDWRFFATAWPFPRHVACFVRVN